MIMSTQKIQFFLFLLLFSCGFTYAAEYTVETVPNMQKADARRFVSNPDGILGPQAESLINTRLDSLRQSTTAEIAVVGVGVRISNRFPTNYSPDGVSDKKRITTAYWYCLYSTSGKFVLK